jgi:hypothetical protein
MIYARWRDEDGEKHVSSAASDYEQAWDLTNLPPLRAGMVVIVGGVQMVLSDPQQP